MEFRLFKVHAVLKMKDVYMHILNFEYNAHMECRQFPKGMHFNREARSLLQKVHELLEKVGLHVFFKLNKCIYYYKK